MQRWRQCASLERFRARELLKELGQGWTLHGRGHLERRYTFKDFPQALAFANTVSDSVLKFSWAFVPMAEKRMVRQSIVKADQSKPRCGFGRIAHVAVRRRSVDLRLGGLTQYLKRHRPKVLIDQLVLEELSIQRRSAFTEQSPDAMFLPKQLCDGNKIDLPSLTHGDGFNRSLTA